MSTSSRFWKPIRYQRCTTQPDQPGEQAAEADAAAGRRPRGRGRSSPGCPCRGSGTAASARPREPVARSGAPRSGPAGSPPARRPGSGRAARRVAHAHHVAERDDLGMAGQREVGLDGHAAGAVDLGARQLGRAGRASPDALHAGRPDRPCAPGSAPSRAVRRLDASPPRRRCRPPCGRAAASRRAAAASAPPWPTASAGRSRAGGRLASTSRIARLARVDRAEVALQRVARELADLAGHLDAGRAGADDDEGQLGARSSGRSRARPLERGQDARADGERALQRLDLGRDALHSSWPK